MANPGILGGSPVTAFVNNGTETLTSISIFGLLLKIDWS